MSSEGDEIKISAQRNDADYHLAEIVRLTNGGGDVTFPITLTVGGFLISGYLIGGKRFHNEFAENMVRSLAALETEGLERVRKFFSEFGSIYDEPPEGEDQPQLPVTYIHLRDARFFVPGQSAVPANGGVLWRGRLTSVQGFHMGLLQAQ
jgi:hypothetical protein